ncbi:hypothetical protein [Roseateles oligotrophus]|uniref:Uncharacterized protein n=1 Tax=Roseateles oligotrophus TaxID=1769250 RepID=A0ABT2YDK6_9BURK|nr:hypothetical protein [Roseateles oligotrophus]MCV2368101.1 hypothetical protein [Roseateles oligotrophus]
MKLFAPQLKIPKTPPRRLLAGMLTLGAASLAPLAQATQLPPQNLSQMIDKADLIVSGEVTAVKDGIQDGVPYTEVTLKVAGSVKKDLAPKSNYTFRQFGLLKARKMDDGRYLLPAKIEGMPTWHVGERVMTFMNKPASKTGLSTPVGLAQGKFSINGNKAANSFNNAGLFDGVQVVTRGLLRASETSMLSKPAGAVDANVLQGLVSRAVKNNWIATGAMR